jgi:hypothetical protein
MSVENRNDENAGTPGPGGSAPASPIKHSFVGMRWHDGRMPPAEYKNFLIRSFTSLQTLHTHKIHGQPYSGLFLFFFPMDYFSIGTIGMPRGVNEK